MLLYLMVWFQYANSVTIRQTPAAYSGSLGEEAELKCTAEDSSDDTMLWYRQYPGKEPQNLFYSLSTSHVDPKGTVDALSAHRTSGKEFNLKFSELRANHTAVYYCAWSRENSNREAYFGDGTKLVVLDPNLQLRTPKVVLFHPSTKEILDSKKATAICLITNFYPDNIKIEWLVNDEKLAANDTKILTDPNSQANKGGETFSITSRLRLDAQEYLRSKNIVCRIKHYQNGSNPITKEGAIQVNVEACGLRKEVKMQSMETGKLTYLILICKSILYGIFVSVLALKAKASYNKRFD